MIYFSSPIGLMQAVAVHVDVMSMHMGALY